MGVRGKGGKEPEIGESLGEGGELLFVVELVEGRSYGRSFFGCKNALNSGGFGEKLDPLSPNEVELRLANFASDVVIGVPLKTVGFSEVKAS